MSLRRVAPALVLAAVAVAITLALVLRSSGRVDQAAPADADSPEVAVEARQTVVVLDDDQQVRRQDRAIQRAARVDQQRSMALEDLRRELDPRLALDERERVALLVVGPPRVGGVDRRACDRQG